MRLSRIMNHGKIRLLLVALCIGFTACTSDDDDENSTANLLIGYWEVIHFEDHGTDTYTDADGKKVVNNYGENREITSQADEEYAVCSFGLTSCMIIATGDPDFAFELNKPCPYKINGTKLSCPLFSGDYSDHCTIKTLTATTLELEYNEEGTDSEGTYPIHEVYYKRLVMKRIN